ncbi:MAG: efflux RND transporter permease subunit [Bryobacterales bacterium]|nr:efflux RND transporter permease subunit [Bryobacterales bacterium]
MPEAMPPAENHGSGARIATMAIRNPVTICMIFLSIVVMGAIAVSRIPLMLVPKLDAPVMFVMAQYVNATPDQVLESITKPIEEAVATVPGVQRMNSTSSPNGMELQIWCGMAADTSLLRSAIREKIEQIRDTLPEDLRQITIHNFSTDDIPILEGTLTADRDLRTNFEFLDARVRKPLERIPGVGEVVLWGTDRKQVDVYLRIEDIKRHGVDISELFQALDGSALNLSLGRVADGGQRYTAISKGALDSVEAIANFPVGRHNLVLSDVADVVFDQRPRNSGRHQNGTYAVGLAIQKTGEANTVDVVDQIMATFDEWAEDPSMDGLTARWWHNSGEEIEDGLGELVKAGGIGAVLAVVVLFAFLRRLDASLAIGLAIPFSMLTAVGLLYFNGSTLNVLSMMGLMLAAGMLVDNAVVVLESIFQRLEKGDSPERAARLGAGEVTVAVIAATSTTLIIFVPLLFDSESQISIMLSHAGISIIFALLCSLFISLTLIPLAAAKLLRRATPGPSGPGREAFKALAGRVRFALGLSRGGRRTPLMRRYLSAVSWHLDRRYAVGLLGVPALLGASIWALTDVVPNNSPDANAVSSLRIAYEFSENYHYAKIERDFVSPVEDFLHSNSDRFKLESTSSAYGNNWAWTRAYLDADAISPDEIGEIREAINNGLPVIPGARIELGREGQGDRNWISANIHGDEPAVLRQLAQEARGKLLETEGITEVYTDISGASDEVRVRLRRDVARKYNVSPRTVAQVLGIAVRSRRMRNFRTPEGEMELWMGLDPADMQSIEHLKSVVVGGSDSGEQVLLGNVADLSIERVPSRVTRENRRTFTEIHVVYRGQRIEDGREAVKSVLDQLPYPPGYLWSYGFFTQQQNKDAQEFAFSMLLALLMVYFVMAALFESLLHPFAIMLSLPFSAVGIVLFLLLTGTPFNVMAQIGLIILIGIVVNNGIVLINHVNNLRRTGISRRRAILQGCEERLRPICMTAATTIVGLIPLAWGDANLMGMSYFPLARTVMGGLLASTVLTLVVLPTYYVILDDLGIWFRRICQVGAPRPAYQPSSGD